MPERVEAAGSRGADSGSAARLSAARLAAVQALYQIDMTGVEPDAVVREFLSERRGARLGEEGPVVEFDRALLPELVHGVARNRAELDAMIGSLLVEGWSLDRIERVMAAILRAGAYELMHRPGTPARVVISEYVDMAHAFFQGKEISMVNGVLDRLARILRAGEMGTGSGGA